MVRLTFILLLLCPIAVLADGEPGDTALAKQVRALVEDLGDDAFTTREDAFDALRELGGRAVPYLQGAIDHDDPEVAMQVRRVIATIRRSSEQDVLAVLDMREEAEFRRDELERIAARGRELLPALFQILAEEEKHYPSYSYYRVRNTYLVIGRLATDAEIPTLLGLQDTPNVQHRILAGPVLKTLDPEKVRRSAFAILLDSGAPPRQRAQILEMCRSQSFAGTAEKLPEIAKSMLADDDADVRTAAVRYYGMRRDEKILPLLLSAAKDKEETVRAAALRAIRNYRTPDVQTALTRALEDPEAAVRAAALETLRSTAGPEIAPLIRPFLKDPDPMVRSNAAGALGRMGDKTAVPALIALLDERSEEFLNRALHSVISAVGQIGDPSALAPLFQLLKDANDHERIRIYRYLILSSIVQIGGEDVLEKIRPHLADTGIQNLQVVLDAVARLDSEKTVPILMDALENGDTRLRTAAVRGLSRRGHASAAPLIAAALTQESDPWFRSEAVRALTTFRHTESAKVIGELLEEGDPADTRLTSLFYALINAAVLFEIRDAAPRIAELAAASPNYRTLGVDALGRLGNREVTGALKALVAGETNPSQLHRIALALARLGEKQLLTDRLKEIPAGSSQRIEALIALGRLEEARLALTGEIERNPGNSTHVYNMACVLALSGEKKKALAHLARAVALRSFTRQQLLTDPDLAPIRDDPRFEEILKKTR